MNVGLCIMNAMTSPISTLQVCGDVDPAVDCFVSVLIGLSTFFGGLRDLCNSIRRVPRLLAPSATGRPAHSFYRFNYMQKLSRDVQSPLALVDTRVVVLE